MNIRQNADEGATRGDDEALIWARFAQPADGGVFLSAWLDLLVRQLPPSRLATLLLRQPDGAYAPAAAWRAEPADASASIDVSVLGPVCETALQKQRGVIRGLDSGAQIAFPLQFDDTVGAVVAVQLDRHPGATLPALFRRVHWASGWLQAASLRGAGVEAGSRVARAAAVLQALAALEDQPELDGALLAFCNELSAHFSADRVSLGLKVGGGTGRSRLAAMSNAAWFQRKSALVRAIETAQAEALYQNELVQFPPLAGERRAIDAAHRGLAAGHGASAAISLQLRDAGKTLGIVTLERFGRAAPASADAAGEIVAGDPLNFDAATVESLVLAAALAGPVIGLKRRGHRWVSGRLRDGAQSGLAKLFGAGRPGLKLLSAALALGTIWLSMARGEFRVSARASIEGAVQRAVVAPFQGFIAEAPVRAGERVEEGRLLARLDDRELRFERLKWDSERLRSEQRQREALSRADRAGVLVAAAQIAQAQAEIALVDEKLARTRLTAPLAGLVVSGDLSQMLGAPVEQGKVLFEIAPLDSVRVVLQVAEGDYREVAAGLAQASQRPEGLRGTLALTGDAARALPIRLTAVTPVSMAQDGRNSFRVEAELVEEAAPSPAAGAGLRPGMEGVAKVELGQASLIWIWTRTTLDRLRLFLWTWLP